MSDLSVSHEGAQARLPAFWKLIPMLAAAGAFVRRTGGLVAKSLRRGASVMLAAAIRLGEAIGSIRLPVRHATHLRVTRQLERFEGDVIASVRSIECGEKRTRSLLALARTAYEIGRDNRRFLEAVLEELRVEHYWLRKQPRIFSAAQIAWTAPGDDGATGTAASYDIRYSTSAITDANFASATQVTGEPAPAAAGASQTMIVSGLTPSTTYFFAMKTSDEVPNVSALSNVPSLATLAPPDTTAPVIVTSSIEGIIDVAATVHVTTDEAATVKVYYSTTTPVDTSTAAHVDDATLATSHDVALSGLAAATTYYVVIVATDAASNATASTETSFDTTAAP